MKKIYLFLLFNILGITNSQIISGKIIAEENNQPISFARIGVENENVGAISDENGNYKIDLTNTDKTKKIMIQLGGYVSFFQAVKDFVNSDNHNIILKEKWSEIAEVILNPKKYDYKNLGANGKSKKMGFWYHSNGKSSDNWREETAVFFSNKKKLKIEKININIAEFNVDQSVLLNFNVYSVKNNRPDQSILSEFLTAELSENKIKDGVFSTDLKDKSVWINNEDFFVSVQIVSSFKGKMGFSAVLLKPVYIRTYYNQWEKTAIGSPAINIDVKVEKEKRRKI